MQTRTDARCAPPRRPATVVPREPAWGAKFYAVPEPTHSVPRALLKTAASTTDVKIVGSAFVVSGEAKCRWTNAAAAQVTTAAFYLSPTSVRCKAGVLSHATSVSDVTLEYTNDGVTYQPVGTVSFLDAKPAECTVRGSSPRGSSGVKWRSALLMSGVPALWRCRWMSTLQRPTVATARLYLAELRVSATTGGWAATATWKPRLRLPRSPLGRCTTNRLTGPTLTSSASRTLYSRSACSVLTCKARCPLPRPHRCDTHVPSRGACRVQVGHDPDH